MRRDLFEEEHEALRASFRAWLDKEVVPHHLEWEQAGIVPARAVRRRPGAHGFLGMAIPEEYGGGGVDDFRYNLVIGEEIQAAGVGGAGLGITLHNDICLPYFLRYCTDEQTRALAAGHRVGRADHRHRHDRAGHRLGPRVDVDHRDPRRRPLRRQRLEDVHHQRHQRRPRHHRGEDRPEPAPQGHVAARPRAGHGRLRARPQPRQDRPALPGHRRAVLHRRRACPSTTCSATRARGSCSWCTTCRRSGCRSPSPASPRPAPRSAGRSTT